MRRLMAIRYKFVFYMVVNVQRLNVYIGAVHAIQVKVCGGCAKEAGIREQGAARRSSRRSNGGTFRFRGPSSTLCKP